MNGLFQWFKSSTKMKRWIFLCLIGIIFASYGMAEVLILKEMSFKVVAKIIIMFVIGFVCIILGLVFGYKRTLEVLIESTDKRMSNKNNINVNSLIFNKQVYDKGPKIVVIGGGSGLNTVLSGMKKYTGNITAIVTVSDYGEKQEKSNQILTLQDIKNSIISLSRKENEMSKLLNYKFTQNGLNGISFSDLYFMAMQSVNGDFTKSIKGSNDIFNMVGNVLPVTLDEMNICAELENGYIVKEKSKITEIVTDKVTKINRIYLNPSNCRPAPGVIEAIKEADSIIIGPGSLYTNVIPNLLVSGVTKAIKESKAIKIYISNIMTDPGQTDNYSVSDHINAIIEHCGEEIIDYCIYDTGEIVPEFIKKYNMEGAELVDTNIDEVHTKGIKFLQRKISKISDDRIRHDEDLVASSVIQLICDDLKYQDKQNDPQYLMMNTKLKEDKKINKRQQAIEKARKKGKEEPKTTVRKSKFNDKYRERIESIKASSNKQNK